MTLDLPGGLFGQEDVRETSTPASSALTGTQYWSAPGCQFEPNNPDIQDVRQSGANGIAIQDASAVGGFILGVNIPHGATVTAVVVYGSDTAKNWEMRREIITGTGSATTMTTSTNFSTEETNIVDPIVNNQTHRYWILTDTLANTDIIYGARITYTI